MNRIEKLPRHRWGMIPIIFFVAVRLWASQKYDVTGVLLKVDRQNQTMSVSCREIPGYMDAMVMPFAVHNPKMLEGLEPGMIVDFSLVVEKDSSYAENIHVRPFESLELDPTEARRLKLMDNAMATKSNAMDVVQVGQSVPNFSLTDQIGHLVSLSQFKGKVVAVTFIYTRCPLPDYCLRLSNNFGLVQRRFRERMGRDLILLSITFDPEHDQPEIGRASC